MITIDLPVRPGRRGPTYLYRRGGSAPRPPGPRRRFGTLLPGLALLALAARAALATVVPWMDLPAITRQAEVIVLGTVESSESRWSDDGRIIVTRSVVKVERPFKGGPRGSVTVEEPGGRVGEQAMVASGAPVLRAGERVILFLEPTGGPMAPGETRRHAVVGWNQGRMTVRKDPRTGRESVDDRSAGALYLDPQGRPVGPGQSGKGPVELQQFLTQIERLVSEQSKRKAP